MFNWLRTVEHFTPATVQFVSKFVAFLKTSANVSILHEGSNIIFNLASYISPIS